MPRKPLISLEIGGFLVLFEDLRKVKIPAWRTFGAQVPKNQDRHPKNGSRPFAYACFRRSITSATHSVAWALSSVANKEIKTRLTEEEYAEFSERVTLCKMSQSEYIRQALIKSSIRPVITVSPVNDELLSAVGKLTAEYGKIGGNLNQIARCLNEYGAPYNALSQEVRAATAELAALKFEVLQKVGEAVGNIQTYQL